MRRDLTTRSIITAPPTHSVGCRLVTVVGVCLSSSVTRRICNATHQGTARGGPVVLDVTVILEIGR